MSGTIGWTKGDVSDSTTLVAADYWWEKHTNELRESMPTAIVGLTENAMFSCDGTADDVQIQAAINYASANGGGNVFILPGTYDITAAINLCGSLNLYGAGWSTFLDLHGTTNTHVLSLNSLSNVSVSDIQIDGGGQTVTGYSGINSESVTNLSLNKIYVHDCISAGIGFGTASNSVRITGCKIINNKYGISGHLVDGIIYGNICGTNTLEGIYNLGCNKTILANNICNSSSSRNGIAVESSQDVIVIGNICNDNATNGIFTEGDGTPPYTFSGNICRDNGNNGIWIKDDQSILVGNQCESNDLHGIRVYSTGIKMCSVLGNVCNENQRTGISIGGGNHNIVNGNQVFNNNQIAGTFSGVRLLHSGTACDYNVVNNNVCSDTQVTPTQIYGISEEGTTDYNMIIGNICTGNATGGIGTIGANSTIDYNIVA